MIKIYLIYFYEKYIKCLKNCYCYKNSNDSYQDDYQDHDELDNLIDHHFETTDTVIFYE